MLLANAGIPMLVVYGPLLLLAFIPIVFVESTCLFAVAQTTFRRCLAWTTGANLLSTVVGVPLTWIALVVLQLIVQVVISDDGAHDVEIHAFTWQAPWLLPYEDDLHWMIPAAGLSLTLPFFLASVLIERWWLSRGFRDAEPRPPLWRVVLVGNTASYGLIAGFWAFYLYTSLASH